MMPNSVAVLDLPQQSVLFLIQCLNGPTILQPPCQRLDLCKASLACCTLSRPCQNSLAACLLPQLVSLPSCLPDQCTPTGWPQTGAIVKLAEGLQPVTAVVVRIGANYIAGAGLCWLAAAAGACLTLGQGDSSPFPLGDLQQLKFCHGIQHALPPCTAAGEFSKFWSVSLNPNILYWVVD